MSDGSTRSGDNSHGDCHGGVPGMIGNPGGVDNPVDNPGGVDRPDSGVCGSGNGILGSGHTPEPAAGGTAPGTGAHPVGSVTVACGGWAYSAIMTSTAVSTATRSVPIALVAFLALANDRSARPLAVFEASAIAFSRFFVATDAIIAPGRTGGRT